jgi:hypothetical protein
MLALYALGKLNFYNEVFNLKYFFDNINRYLGNMLLNRFVEKHHSYYDEIYACFTKRGIRIPSGAKMYAMKLVWSAIKERVKEAIKSLA